ncbi:hypothetical protein [Silvibacterium dinghuense]|uniref:Uncharacterized protein n=1 Tax=Silvibacterium dinghuense TaxID=1560006 RepID=A0A4Q1SHY9_9BACT|nr:hypothetical protein [Silvibacterium dinghuense]RXS96973.1 hypothetical protein ESZ00_03285 [Silvibacterium dinghuense]GGG95144.1 hypothetical protein GCM10011586_07670 [Silvibacterium dinghuense]
MQTTYLDNALWGIAFLGECALLCILLFRRAFRSFPVFTLLISLYLASEGYYYFFLRHASYNVYLKSDFIQSLILSAVELGVLIEIAANVLAPAKRSLLGKLFSILFILIGLFGLGGFTYAMHANASSLAHPRTIFVANNTIAILRLITFLVIAGFAQVLGLGWKNHVLRLASGLAFYAAVSLVATLLQNRMHGGPSYYTQYHALQQVVGASYICALYYWSYAFLRKEAPRKEFNSKMSEFLISISAFPKQQQSIVARKHR